MGLEALIYHPSCAVYSMCAMHESDGDIFKTKFNVSGYR